MSRRGQIKHGGESHHIIQRGNYRSACFFSVEDYWFYLESVAAGATRYHCAIHAYLLATPQESEGLSLMMRYLGCRYVRDVNSAYQQSGTLWEGRYKAQVASVLSRSVRAGKPSQPKKRRTEPAMPENNELAQGGEWMRITKSGSVPYSLALKK